MEITYTKMNMRTEIITMTVETGNFIASSNWGHTHFS